MWLPQTHPSVDHTCRGLRPTWVAPATDFGHLQPLHDFLMNSVSTLVTKVIFSSSSLFFSSSSPKSNSSLRCGFQLSSTSPSHWSFHFSAQHVLGTSCACYTAEYHTIHFWTLHGRLLPCTTLATSPAASQQARQPLDQGIALVGSPLSSTTVWMVGIWRCTTTLPSTTLAMQLFRRMIWTMSTTSSNTCGT